LPPWEREISSLPPSIKLNLHFPLGRTSTPFPPTTPLKGTELFPEGGKMNLFLSPDNGRKEKFHEELSHPLKKN